MWIYASLLWLHKVRCLFIAKVCLSYNIILYTIGSLSPTLKDLVYELKEVDWYQLGVQLNVSVHILNNIDRENFGEPRKLSKVLQYWIDNAKPVASWKTIVRALERIDGHKNILLSFSQSICLQ